MHLPPNRAFLVKFSDDEASAPDGLKGRVEHVRSGKRFRFGSLAELRSFVLRVFEDEHAEETGTAIRHQDESLDLEPR